MNYMKDVAKLLGVEPGERFRIEGDIPEYWLADDGVHWEQAQDESGIDNSLLTDLIMGTGTIVKKPWRPIDGEGFWYVALIGGEEVCYESDIFDDLSTVDIMFLAFGNCFRTREDADAHKDEIIAKMQEALER